MIDPVVSEEASDDRLSPICHRPKSKQIVPSDLPFQPGQRVEIVVIAEEEQPVNLVRELREVLQVTQALPQTRTISEDDIAAYWAG
jgi:hypothetical protein